MNDFYINNKKKPTQLNFVNNWLQKISLVFIDPNCKLLARMKIQNITSDSLLTHHRPRIVLRKRYIRHPFPFNAALLSFEDKNILDFCSLQMIQKVFHSTFIKLPSYKLLLPLHASNFEEFQIKRQNLL